MSNKLPRITVPGLRGGVPGGYALARTKGRGPVQLIPLAQLRKPNTAADLSSLVTAGGSIKLPVSTVASLPSAATEGVGALRAVLDADSGGAARPPLGSPVVGGGAFYVAVLSDGANWIVN